MDPFSLRTLTALALLGLPATALADPLDALRAEVTARAEAAGIPADPLVNKIDEGAAKGVPAMRIRPVVSRLHDRLVESSPVCAGVADGGLCIVAAADAIAAGASPEALRSLVDDHAAALVGAERTRALVAVSALGARGVSPDAAIGQVAQALERAGGLDALVPSATPAESGVSPATPGVKDGPPAVGRGGELPVANPASDRENRGKGKARGNGAEGPPGRPASPGNSGNAGNGNNGNGNGNGNAGGNGRGNGNGK